MAGVGAALCSCKIGTLAAVQAAQVMGGPVCF
jgi:hypothetical protein